jgi:hypothetical protein
MRELLIPLASAFATAIGGTLVAWFLARVRSGRLTRTLDQATRLIEFIQRFSTGYDGLAKISEAMRSDAERLLLDTMRAVREDFAAERAVLPEFEKTSSSVRSALLLYVPHRTIIWLLYIPFYTLLLFMLYVCIVRAAQWEWGMGDTVALLIAGVFAALVRLAVLVIAHE